MPITTLFVDLDDTVYPANSGVWGAISQRIDEFVMQKFNLEPQAARARRQDLFLRYGTTMRGLQAEYHIDEDEYLAFVHDVPLRDLLRPDPALAAVLRGYSQRKLIFTNADVPHAGRVLGILGLEGCFDAVIDIKAMAPYCKPMAPAFERALALAGATDPACCALLDDQAHNVRAARALGMYTVQVGPVGANEQAAAHVAIASLAELPDVLPLDGEAQWN
jgi:putative hydrolase of the HAD superfamily